MNILKGKSWVGTLFRYVSVGFTVAGVCVTMLLVTGPHPITPKFYWTVILSCGAPIFLTYLGLGITEAIRSWPKQS